MRFRAAVFAFALLVSSSLSAEDACKKCQIYIWPENNMVGAECVVPPSGEYGSHTCHPWVTETSAGAMLGCSDSEDICYYLEVGP